MRFARGVRASALALAVMGSPTLLPHPARAEGAALATGTAAMPMKRAKESPLDCQVPDVSLVREDGKTVSLSEELKDGRPVALNFIYTSCPGICPVMSQIFAQLQEKLGGAKEKVHLVSISLDPEYDTPARLVEYARRYHAGPEWRFYTGTAAASQAAQRAFAAYRGDKMNHTPVTFLRAGEGNRWLRVDGFATSDELANRLRQPLGAP